MYILTYVHSALKLSVPEIKQHKEQLYGCNGCSDYASTISNQIDMCENYTGTIKP